MRIKLILFVMLFLLTGCSDTLKTNNSENGFAQQDVESYQYKKTMEQEVLKDADFVETLTEES